MSRPTPAPRSDGIRRANLSVVLRLIHERGPRSRAELTRETGLNRSTVAHLIAALSARGLVAERDPTPQRRVGRPSPVVAASDDLVALAVNPEVDAIEVAAVSLAGRVRERNRVLCPEAPTVAEVVRVVDSVLREWRSGPLRAARLAAVGVAVPGLVQARTGTVRLAPHLGWHDADLASPLAAAIGVPVAVDNDATLGVLAERLFGAAAHDDDVIYLNGGASGIGGGIVLRGIHIRGADGYAGEWGQVSLAGPDSGVLEDEVSRARLLRIARLGPVDDHALAAALADASPALRAEVDRQRSLLAVALGNAVNVLNPSKVVLGGFLALLRERGADEFDALVRRRAMPAPAERVTLTSAALGADRLLIGAAEAAFAELLDDPLAM